jgi:tetratricopeptide (TPR) repeat protein
MMRKRRSVILLLAFFLVSGLFYSVGYCQGEIWIGVNAPPFTLNDLEGNPRSLTEHKGDRATVLVFWSTWSAYSGEELTRLDEIYEKLKDSGLSVIGINVDKQIISGADRDEIGERLKELDLRFPTLIDQGLDTFHRYGVVAVPTTVILDSEGVIRYILPGYPLVKREEMFQFLEALISGEPVEVKKGARGYIPKPKAVRYYGMGKKAFFNNNAESAIRYFKMSERIDREFVAVRLMMGQVYDRLGRTEEAEAAYRSALKIEPENGVAMAQLGHILLEVGRPEEAQKLLERALALDDSYSPAHYYYGLALGIASSMEEAESHFKTAEELNPLDYKLYLTRAEVYSLADRQREAAEEYRKALETLLGYDLKTADDTSYRYMLPHFIR